MPEKNLFVYKQKINAPVDLIYRAFTSASALREWLCDVSTANPVVGGRIYLAWTRGYYASGHFTELIPNQSVAFSWIGKSEPGWTKVAVSIGANEDGSDVHTVKLQHTGLGNSADWESARKEIAEGWEMGLDNLKSTLEEGRDLRVMNRPLIGIYPEDLTNLNEAAKQKLMLPVDYGVLVRDIVPDFGAEKAGIQVNDVIVAIEGQKVERIRSLGVIINEYSPGDQIEVSAYRGTEKLTFNIDTAAQSAQALPDSPEELAKELEASSSEVLETLEGVLKNVTDAEASFSPGPEEWSVKETLVHLIHNEREIHIWINDLVSGQERFYDEWPGDRLFRIRATLASYPTMDDLVAELRRSLKETVASIAFLDQNFTRRKASYWRLGMELLGGSKHFREHIQQIEDNVQAARMAVGRG